MSNLTEGTRAALEEERYNIVRFYRQGRRKTIFRNVRLDVARLHCNDPRTRKAGVWFDGYEKV